MPCTVHSAPSSGVVHLPPFTRVASRLIRLIETRLRCLLYSNCVSIQMVPPCAVSTSCARLLRELHLLPSSAVTLLVVAAALQPKHLSRRSCPAETTWLTRHAIAGANHASMPVAASTSLLRADELVVRQRARRTKRKLFAFSRGESRRFRNRLRRGKFRESRTRPGGAARNTMAPSFEFSHHGLAMNSTLAICHEKSSLCTKVLHLSGAGLSYAVARPGAERTMSLARSRVA